MTSEMTSAVSRAFAFFEDAATAPNPIPAFVGGMRAMCDGVGSGPLPTLERGAFWLLLTAVRPNLLRFAEEMAVDADRLEGLWPLMEPFMHTLAVLPAWSMTPDERASRGLTTHEELCAQVRRLAESLEHLEQLASFAPPDSAAQRGCH